MQGKACYASSAPCSLRSTIHYKTCVFVCCGPFSLSMHLYMHVCVCASLCLCVIVCACAGVSVCACVCLCVRERAIERLCEE